VVSAEAWINPPIITTVSMTGSGPDGIWGTADDIDIGGDGIPNTLDDWGPDGIAGTPDDPIRGGSSGIGGTYRDDQGNVQTADWDLTWGVDKVGAKWDYWWTLENFGSGRIVKYTGPPRPPGPTFIVGPTVPGVLLGTAGLDRIPGTADDLLVGESETHVRLQKGPPIWVRYSLKYNPDTGPGDLLRPSTVDLTNIGPEYQEVLPGETATYTIRVTNIGSETDTILLEHEIIFESGYCSWTVDLSKDSVTLDPDAYEDVTLSVTAPSDCEISSRNKVKVTGTSQNGLDVGETITDSVIKETHAIPEFTTIAIPVAAILGLLFLFSRRKRK
jgi:hypothetical protein